MSWSGFPPSAASPAKMRLNNPISVSTKPAAGH
jgi:hypothetical protein